MRIWFSFLELVNGNRFAVSGNVTFSKISLHSASRLLTELLQGDITD
jgi:hypothetical protein